jgi:hypothetical protein
MNIFEYIISIYKISTLVIDDITTDSIDILNKYGGFH